MIPLGMEQMAIDIRRRTFISALGGAARIAIALAFTSACTMRRAAQDFIAPSGAPAEAFPKPQQDATRIRQSLQSGRNVDAVAENVAILHHDVADIDANPQHNVLRRFRLAL
jgi:hypothetical protein